MNADGLRNGLQAIIDSPPGSAHRIARQLLASLEGMALVPVIPTKVMHEAARDWSHKKYGKSIGNDASAGCWEAMLAAHAGGEEGK